MHRYWDAFLTDESSVEEGGSVVASVAVVHSSHSESSSTNEAVTNSDSMADTSNEAVSDTDSVAEASNNSVTDSSNQAVSNESRGDNTDSPHPVGADTVGGARVVSNSSDRGSESLGLGDAPVLALQGLDHRLVGGLAACHHGVTNASHETVTSHKAAMSPNESTRSRDKTVASNEASVSSNETKVGNRGCSGGSHKSNNRCKGLEIKN